MQFDDSSKRRKNYEEEDGRRIGARKNLITINKNDGDITPSSIVPPTREARISGENEAEREGEGRTERAIIPISTARVVDLSNQSVAAPGGRK